ncbi:MAG: MFS transporter [Oscillospiraceae bacterium]|nr:MFS transporter [Oscillospiraceae bacterium]
MPKFYFNRFNCLQLFNGLIFYAPVALLVRTQAGMTVSQFLLLQAVLSIVIFAGEVPAGMVTDRIGYKNSIVLSQLLLLSARACLMAAFLMKSLPLFVLEAALEGLSNVFYSGTYDAYLYGVYGEEEYLRRSTLANNFGTIGFILSTLLYYVFYACFGITGLLVSSTISSLAATVCSLGLEKEKSKPEKQEKGSAHVFRTLLKSRELWTIMLISACLTMAMLFINFFYVDKLMAVGLDEKLMTPIILGYSVVELLNARIAKRINSKNQQVFFTVSSLILCAGLILFGVLSDAVPVVILMLILPLLVDIPSVILSKYENDFIDRMDADKNRATVLSVFSMGGSLPEIAMLLVSSALSGAGTAVCFIALGVTIILLLPTFCLDKMHKK